MRFTELHKASHIALASLLVGGAAFADRVVSPHFVSTVQLAVQENNPVLVQRSQRLVVEQFNHTFDDWPEFQGKHYDVRMAGNEVVLYLITNDDMRAPMQHAVSAMIQNLNGRVRARGKSLYYRTSMSQPMSGYLEVAVDDTHTKIRSIAAQSVPLRDLLKEIRTQLGSLSYLIPGECADRLVDWSFGEEAPAEAKSIDSVMTELATLFSLKCEKRNGSYIYTGECTADSRHPVRAPLAPAEILRGNLPPTSPAAHTTEVYFPLMPLGE